MASATATIVSDEEDDVVDFMANLVPCLAMSFLLQRKRKRTAAKTSKKRKRSGRIGRTWKQRKKGQQKPEDFTWWKLIHKPDVGDRTSRNRKVKTHCMPICGLAAVCLLVCVFILTNMYLLVCVCFGHVYLLVR